MARDLRVVVIGAGWIVPFHLAALDRLGRATVVGVASARLERAEAVAEPRGAAAATDGIALVERGIPFLTEKPLAATDAAGPERLADAIDRRRLVVAVGYHLRALVGLDEVRDRIASTAPLLVAGRWLDSTPAPAWWRRVGEGGGQVIEQATHLYDLARHLVGEAEVASARSIHHQPVVPAEADVADGTTAILHYTNGAIGSLVNSRRAARRVIGLDILTDAAQISIEKVSDAPGDWAVSIADGGSARTLPSGLDPYEVQAEAFLDAVEANDPSLVLSTYRDALATDRLTRAVVAATGQTG